MRRRHLWVVLSALMDHTSAHRPLPKIAHHPQPKIPATFDRASDSSSEMMGLLDLVVPSSNLLLLLDYVYEMFVSRYLILNHPAWIRNTSFWLQPRKQSMIPTSGRLSR